MRTKLYKIIVLILISSLLNKITLSCKEKNKELKMIRGEQIGISPELQEDQEILAAVQPYHDSLQKQINEPLCYTARTLSREESPLESSLGNFYADTCFEVADSIFFSRTGNHIDFALFNYGGIRTAIPKGDITVDNMFKLMPFENKLVVVRLSGEKTAELLAYLANRKQAHPVSGIRLVLNGDRFSTVEIGNAPFNRDKNYYVLTHDYLQHGGDQMAFFKEPLDLFKTNYKVRDALIDRLRRMDTLRTSLDKRFTYIDHQ